MEKSSIAGHTGGGGNEPQGRQGFLSKIPFFKFFTKSKFSVSNVNKYYVGVKPQPTLNCVGHIEKRLIKNSLCHPELAAPLVSDEKEAYKGGCSQSISGSSHRQKCATICTVSWKEVLDKVGWAFSPTMKLCWGRNPNIQKAISSASRKATRHVRGDLVPAFTLAEVFSPYYLSPRRIAFTLAEVFLPSSPSPRKVAFTLAEVLITLGIIGVVAAMTLPMLIAKYRAKELETQFKKAYSVLCNVHQRMVADYDNVYNTFYFFDERTSDEIEMVKERYSRIFVSYLNGATLCTFDNSILKCSGNKTPASYKSYDGNYNAHLSPDSINNIAILTNDGMVFFFGGYYRPYRIYIDTNGTDKGPNRLGFDLFAFDVDKTDKIIPAKYTGSHYDEEGNVFSENGCSIKTGLSSYNGFGCSRFALIDQHPDDITHSYWSNLPR